MLIFGGVVISLVAGLFHADAASANDHVASFTEYAQSDIWIGVHLGQFVGMALFAGGMIALLGALNLPQGALALTARFGALSAAVSIALYGVLQAVDGVALKHAVNAWASAAEPETSAPKRPFRGFKGRLQQSMNRNVRRRPVTSERWPAAVVVLEARWFSSRATWPLPAVRRGPSWWR